MKWVLMLARFVFLLCLGAMLFFAPWGALWHQNFFLVRYSWASAIGHNDFVRGAISGLGLTNIWLAIEEIRRLGDSPPPVATRSAR
jgi:hypothetical protein